MFNQVFVEKEVLDTPQVNKILSRLNKDAQSIDQIDHYFGRVKKPYLQKRDTLNLFIGKKRGKLVKEAPAAYGLAGEPHFYYIHAYNCLYECTYCYLQGYFQSPDMVFFVNHDEIQKEMDDVLGNFPKDKRVWFHAGEYSDSLALSHITGELESYHQWFAKNPRGILELRTKSANTKELEKLAPLPNVVTSFSLSPAKQIKVHDLKTPSLKHRIAAMVRLKELGHPIAVHLDPVILSPSFLADYQELLNELKAQDLIEAIEYISAGVVRFTKDVFHQVKKNYPDSPFLTDELVKSENGLVRYPRALRLHMLKQLKKLLMDNGIDESKIYLCMEL